MIALLKFLPYILGIIGAGFLALRIRQSGVNSERAKQQAADAKARDISDSVQNDVGALPGSDARKELGTWTSKS
jgi:hypothetical protein